MIKTVIALAVASASLAQPGTALAQPRDPADARAPARPLAYDSAFSGYRTFEDVQVAPWAATNEAVRPAPKAQTPAQPASPSRPSSPRPASAGGTAHDHDAHGGARR